MNKAEVERSHNAILSLTGEVEELKAKIEAVRALHGPRAGSPDYCVVCLDLLPCSTLKAIEGGRR